jgi:hypothetical protein
MSTTDPERKIIMKRLIQYGAIVAVAGHLVLAMNVARADTVTASGTFTGASKHVTTGGVSIVETKSGGAVVILDTNFSLDGAPGPRVGLGKDGKYDSASDLGVLTNKDGLQSYVVPAGVDVSKYNEVYIWCRKYSVPLGVAAIK